MGQREASQPGRRDTGKTRERILDAASRVLRREGYAAAGVDRLAAEAGLTSGAIYGHFRGKQDLLTEVVKRSVIEQETNREQGLEHLSGAAWVRGMLRRYLSREHCRGMESGCPIPALVSELGRAGEEPKAAFAEAGGRLVARVEQKWLAGEAAATLSAAQRRAIRQRALAGLAMAVGGIALARALGDSELAEELLEACAGEGVEALIRDAASSQEGER